MSLRDRIKNMEGLPSFIAISHYFGEGFYEYLKYLKDRKKPKGTMKDRIDAGKDSTNTGEHEVFKD